MSRLPTTLAWAAALALSSCAAPMKPLGAEASRAEWVALKNDPLLAPQVPAALAEAELAVIAAELPTRDTPAGQHAVRVADRKIGIARAEAERQIAEAALQQLAAQRRAILEDAQHRALEITRAQAQAAADAALAQQQATQAALAEAATARLMNEELRRQMDELQAKTTDRGVVITLGDVLFATGKADLQPGATEQLDKLAAFMQRYIDRTLLIEGHTDAQGSDADNLRLSARRAEAVKVYLIIQSVDSERIATLGRGSESPLADNTTAEGRQQNRRVEIVISNTATTAN